MRVFLTGATGFLGAYVLRKLLQSGHSVAALVRQTSSAWRIVNEIKDVELITGDLGSLDSAVPTLTRFKPEAIVHLAWGGVPSAHRMSAIQKDNVEASIQLLRLASDLRVRRWLGLGSSAEYGALSGHLNEQHPTNPTNEYGRAKLAISRAVLSPNETGALSCTWIRLFSLYGPMESDEWFLPHLITELLRGRRPALTEGMQRADYLYVDDAAAAVVRLMENMSAKGIFNLGSGCAISIRELAEKTRDLIDPALSLGFGEASNRPGQAKHQQADIQSLSNVIDWKPETPLDDGLANTVTWFRKRSGQPLRGS